MKIKSIKFLKSAIAPIQELNNPEIAFVGRSNVGKSSLINSLSNTKSARVSSTPGRTRLINYFDINNGQFTLVDLPGYGYAKVGNEEKKKWADIIEGYFGNSQNLKHVFLLLDIRHTPSVEDFQMIEYLNYYRIDYTPVATKIDKLSKNELRQCLQKLAISLKVGVDNIITVSSTKLCGLDKLEDRLFSIL